MRKQLKKALQNQSGAIVTGPLYYLFWMILLVPAAFQLFCEKEGISIDVKMLCIVMAGSVIVVLFLYYLFYKINVQRAGTLPNLFSSCKSCQKEFTYTDYLRIVHFAGTSSLTCRKCKKINYSFNHNEIMIQDEILDK